MQISCPICDTSIEVSKFLIGQKGRCPRCSSKFIIPGSEDDEPEILERGEIPKDEPKPVPPPAESEATEESKPEPEPAPAPEPRRQRPAAKSSSGAPRVRSSGARGPRLPAAGGAPARAPARPVVVRQSSGAFGFLFAIVLAALVGVVVYVMMDKNSPPPVADDGPNEEEPVKEEPKPRPQPQPVVPADPVGPDEGESIAVYASVLKPVFEAKCVSCHGAEKAKGRLAMHTYEKLMAGGGNGPIVEPDSEDPQRIEMIYRAELPEDDEEHMPPQGKPQLTADELAVLKWWVKEGAHERLDSHEAPDELRQKIEALAKVQGVADAG